MTLKKRVFKYIKLIPSKQLEDWLTYKILALIHIFKKKGISHIDPIFIVGCNRSGTSLLATILAQHPKIELVAVSERPKIGLDGHSKAYGEADIWRFITPVGHAMWGLPQYISHTYRNAPKNKREIRKIKRDLLINRNTNKIPLVKIPKNMLRIGLLSKIFPSSKFVLIVRNLDNYVEGFTHKNKIRENIALHWYLLNSIALHDLELFVPSKYLIINLEDMHKKNNDTIKKLEEIYKLVGVSPLKNISLEDIRDDFIYKTSEELDNIFKWNPLKSVINIDIDLLFPNRSNKKE